jgi:hypothetical protein
MGENTIVRTQVIEKGSLLLQETSCSLYCHICIEIHYIESVVNQMITLRKKLIIFGILITGSSIIFFDVIAVVDSSIV